jgi:hypothetical protein
VISIEPDLAQDQPGALVPCHDLRKVGLQSATLGLRANVGDLGIVLEARAKSDVTFCPVCRVVHDT